VGALEDDKVGALFARLATSKTPIEARSIKAARGLFNDTRQAAGFALAYRGAQMQVSAMLSAPARIDGTVTARRNNIEDLKTDAPTSNIPEKFKLSAAACFRSNGNN